MPLHIDKRPKKLDDFLGNEGIKNSLQSVITREVDKPQAFLFVGPKGCGKTTLARIVGSMIGCDATSIHEYNMAHSTGIDTIRSIIDSAQYSPTVGKFKMYILDEAHCMTKGNQGAQNALLKILEEPPKHVFFALCTTDPEKLLDTVISRCMKFEVKNLPPPILTKLIKDTLLSEGIDDFPLSVINEIVKSANGCPRQALILLDSVIDIIDENVALAAISEATATETASIELCRLLLSDQPNKWLDVKYTLINLPDDAETIRYSILGYMEKVMLGDKTDTKTVKKAQQLIDCFRESYMYTKRAGLVSDCFLACGV